MSGYFSLFSRRKNIHAIILFLICALSYAALVAGRSCLAVTATNIMQDIGCQKTEIGFISTVFFLIYGSMQIVIGFVSDHISPRYIISTGLLGSSVFTAITGFANSMTILIIGWSGNAVFQSFLWPAICKINLEWQPKKMRMFANAGMSVSAPLGTLMLYLSSAYFLGNLNWRAVFIFNSSLLLCVSVLVYFLIPYCKNRLAKEEDTTTAVIQEEEPSLNSDKKVKTTSLIVGSGVIWLALSAGAGAVLREGINMWAPTFFVEQYNLKSSLVSLMISCFPFFNIGGSVVAAELVKKNKGKRLPTLLCGFSFSIIAISVLRLTSLSGYIVGVLTMACLSGVMMGINTVVTSVAIPFAKIKKTGTVSGFINYIASLCISLSGILFGYISDTHGLTTIFGVWILIALAGLAFVCCAIHPWQNYQQVLK